LGDEFWLEYICTFGCPGTGIKERSIHSIVTQSRLELFSLGGLRDPGMGTVGIIIVIGSSVLSSKINLMHLQ